MNTSSILRHRARSALALAGLALILGVGACGGDDGGGDEPGSERLDLVIGNLLPLSGTSNQLGAGGAKASGLALDQITAAIQDSGADHSVRAIQRDEGPDAETASQAAKKLTKAGAACLTGPWSVAAVEQAAHDVAIPSETLEIATVPATDRITELSDNDLLNSTALPVSTEGSALADAIESDLGGTDGYTVNVAVGDDDYGDTLAQDFTEEWQNRDGTIGDGGAQATLVISDPTGFPQLVSQLSSSSGWDPGSAWGSDQLVDPGLPKQVGAEAVTGMRALAPGSPNGDEASLELGPFAAQEFDATVLCYLAAVAAGSTDGQKMADELIDITAPGGDKFTWQQLPEAIQALERGEDIDYNGASGPIDMDVHGNPTSGVFDIYQHTSKGLAVVGEIPVEKPNPATP